MSDSHYFVQLIYTNKNNYKKCWIQKNKILLDSLIVISHQTAHVEFGCSLLMKESVFTKDKILFYLPFLRSWPSVQVSERNGGTVLWLQCFP